MTRYRLTENCLEQRSQENVSVRLEWSSFWWVLATWKDEKSLSHAKQRIRPSGNVTNLGFESESKQRNPPFNSSLYYTTQKTQVKLIIIKQWIWTVMPNLQMKDELHNKIYNLSDQQKNPNLRSVLWEIKK